MRKRTIYTLPKDTEPTGKVIADLIEKHSSDLPIFRQLESYMDDEPEMTREAPTNLLTIHNFADYIVSVNTGYMLGNPIDYRIKGASLDPVMEVYRHQNIDEVDGEIGEDCSIFGQAFENVYLDEKGNVRSARLDVNNTIVVYDDTFKHSKMFAVYYSPVKDASKSYDVTIWTRDKVLEGTLTKEVLEVDEKPHFAETVPVIQYFNNKRLKGDFEPVISLIDAYNILQSDRVLDRERLVDAILAFLGGTVTEEDMESIKKYRTVGLKDGQDAKYITKDINEADADVLRRTLAQDIHKFSKTPDLSDETFSNSPSGVSILYKLLAFEQNIKKKELQFNSGLRHRLSIYSTLLRKAGKLNQAIDVDNVSIVFKRELPRNDYEVSQMINNLTGIVSDETLAGQLSFVDDASQEVERAKAEAPQLGAYGTDEAEE